jgi:hypothetical protein
VPGRIHRAADRTDRPFACTIGDLIDNITTILTWPDLDGQPGRFRADQGNQ